MAIVKSLSVIVTAVFSGRAIEDICMLSPISSPSKSISITVGIDSTEHINSIYLLTTFIRTTTYSITEIFRLETSCLDFNNVLLNV